MKRILTNLVVFILALLFVLGIMTAWYVIDTKSNCRKYERENPNIIFDWSFSTGCVFQLPDGIWFGILEYERQERYEIEIENDIR
jgi:hypothetical protein